MRESLIAMMVAPLLVSVSSAIAQTTAPGTVARHSCRSRRWSR